MCFHHGAGVRYGVKWMPSDGVHLMYLVLPTLATFLRRWGRGIMEHNEGSQAHVIGEAQAKNIRYRRHMHTTH